MLAASPTAYGPNLLARLLAARTLQQIDECAKSAWILNGEGLLGDNEMEYLAPIIQHQRKSIRTESRSGRGPIGPFAPSATRPNRRRLNIPEGKRAAGWLRRRALAKDCIIPTCIARMFTVSKLAVLAVIARAVIDHGFSGMSLPEIAARAGVGCTTARYAIRDAAQMGLITVTENRMNRRWHRPNTIRIVCRRWLDWLAGHRAIRKRGRPETPALRPWWSTPLRNLSATIEIHRFSVHGSVISKAAVNRIPELRCAWFSSRPGIRDGTSGST